MRTKFVQMVHPDLPGQTYKAPRQGVGALKRSGWKLAPPEPAPPAPAESTEAPASSGALSSPDHDQPPQRRRASEKKGE